MKKYNRPMIEPMIEPMIPIENPESFENETEKETENIIEVPEIIPRYSEQVLNAFPMSNEIRELYIKYLDDGLSMCDAYVKAKNSI